MQQTEKIVVVTITALTSLSFYWYAKTKGRDAVPFVMIGGVIGSVIGELVADNIRTKNLK